MSMLDSLFMAVFTFTAMHDRILQMRTEVGTRSSAPAKHAKTPSRGCRTFGANLRIDHGYNTPLKKKEGRTSEKVVVRGAALFSEFANLIFVKPIFLLQSTCDQFTYTY